MERAELSVVSKIGQVLVDELQDIRGVGNKVIQLRDELATMNAVLRVISEAEEGSVDHIVREWEKQVHDLVYDAEDCTDTYSLCISRPMARPSIYARAKRVARYPYKKLVLQRALAADIKDLLVRTTAVSERRARYNIDRATLARAAFLAPVSAASISANALRRADDPHQFVGIREQANELVMKIKAVNVLAHDEYGKIKAPVHDEDDKTKVPIHDQHDKISVGVHDQHDKINAPVHDADDKTKVPIHDEDDKISVAVHDQHDKINAPVHDEDDQIKVSVHDQHDKIEAAVEDEDDKRLKVFYIVGFGGLGKTTLAMELCRQLEADFPYQAQVSVSQAFDVQKDMKGLLVRVLQQIFKQKVDDKMNVEELSFLIEKLLHHKRYLIVIDDVWSLQAWEAIHNRLPENNCASRIIVTTRTESVAKTASAYFLYHMEYLKPEASKELFMMRVFGSTMEGMATSQPNKATTEWVEEKDAAGEEEGLWERAAKKLREEDAAKAERKKQEAAEAKMKADIQMVIDYRNYQARLKREEKMRNEKRQKDFEAGCRKLWAEEAAKKEWARQRFQERVMEEASRMRKREEEEEEERKKKKGKGPCSTQ